MNFKSYQPRMKQNNSTELVGYSFHNTYSEKDPPDALESKPATFPGLSGIFCRKEIRSFFGWDQAVIGYFIAGSWNGWDCLEMTQESNGCVADFRAYLRYIASVGPPFWAL